MARKKKEILTEERAVELAEAFIADKRKECRAGRLESVHHVPVEFFEGAGLKPKSGLWSVTFEYVGPPTPPEFEGFCPPFDHPTVVWVDDRTGKCRLMGWM